MNSNDTFKSTFLLTPIARFWHRDLLPFLADLRLAIGLLLVIAIASISGTVIEQGQGLDFYRENYPEQPALFGFLTWKVLLSLGLDHVYRTWWYLAILILFGSSLIACTFVRQVPALKAAQTWIYYTSPRQFEKLALSTSVPLAASDLTATSGPRSDDLSSDRSSDSSSHRADRSETSANPSVNTFDQASTWLKNQGYRVFQEGDALYARKGLVGRIGPIVVHASMILVLVGSIVGAMTGFLAQEMVPSGQTFQIKNIIDAGPWSAAQVPRDWSVKVNRFWIEYAPNGSIDQFYSDLSVVDRQGQERDRQTIFVNQPLRYGGVTMYQTDWGLAAVQVRINNSPSLRLPMAQLNLPGRVWGTWVPLTPDFKEGVSLLAKDLQGTVLLYDKMGQPIATTRVGRSTQVPGPNGKIMTIAVDDLIGSTGLQIKADPGIPLVYAGFGFLMLGTIASYFSHSQVWLLRSGSSLYIGGRTNRAQVAFEQEMLRAIEVVSKPGF